MLRVGGGEDKCRIPRAWRAFPGGEAAHRVFCEAAPKVACLTIPVIAVQKSGFLLPGPFRLPTFIAFRVLSSRFPVWEKGTFRSPDSPQVLPPFFQHLSSSGLSGPQVPMSQTPSSQPHSRPRRNGRHSHSPNRSRHQPRSRGGAPRPHDRSAREESDQRPSREDHRDWVPVDRGRDIRRRQAAKGPSLLQRILSVLSFGMLGAKKAPAARIPAAARRSTKPERSGPSADQETSARRSSGRSPEGRSRRPAESSTRNSLAEQPQENGESRASRERPVTPPNPEAVTVPRLHVGNLSYDAAESDLLELFKSAGTVESAEVAHHRDTQRSKGFAFVLMGSVEEAQKAVSSLHGQEFMGRRLEIGPARSVGGRGSRGEDRS